VWGTREKKYTVLSDDHVGTTEWVELAPRTPDYYFSPGGELLRDEYSGGWTLSDAMPVNSIGIVTARDSLSIHFTEGEVWDTVRDFAALAPEEARAKYKLGDDVRDWKVADAQQDIRHSGPSKENIRPILYRPFDVRFTYYTGKSRGFHCYPRREVMAHMLAGPNVGLATSRNVEIENVEHFFCSRSPMGHHAVSLKEVDFLYPLYVHAEAELTSGGTHLFKGKRTNFSPAFLAALATKLGRKQAADGMPEGITPEDVLGYAYAVFFAPSYRERYEDFLRRDFPRLPLTSDEDIFRVLAEKGRELISVHTMVSPLLDVFITEFPVKGAGTVNSVSYDASKQRVNINPEQYFGGLPETLWNFQIGGYRVCERWLQDRKGRKLTYDEIQHWQRIVVAVKETTRVVSQIDEAIPSWPLS